MQAARTQRCVGPHEDWMMSDKPLTDVAFSSFDLHPALLAGLEAAGFTRCTPIQALTLPVALPGRDVAGQAQTGTGKTLAFLVAVMNRLLTRPALAERKPEDPRALILAPTRELAIQIHKDAVKFASDLGLKFALVYGGVDYDKQREALQKGADVIIATPGRLIDYVKQHKVVSLHACEMCVLDEADRMFDLGFIKDIRFLLRRMPIRTERQTLLFEIGWTTAVGIEHGQRDTLRQERASVAQLRIREASGRVRVHIDEARCEQAILGVDGDRRCGAGEPADPRLATAMREHSRQTRRILVRDRGRIRVIDADTIDWIEAADYYAMIHAGGESHLLRETMNELEQRLDPARFFRVHRSAIIPLDRVKEIHPLFRGDRELVLADGKRIRLSRTRRAAFEAQLAAARPRS